LTRAGDQEQNPTRIAIGGSGSADGAAENGGAMPVKQGDLALLDYPAAQELLASRIPARLAYVWLDGTPRVGPIWFHWNEQEFVMGTAPKALKLKALAKNPKVALTIDDNTFPHKVLLVRGAARLESVEGIVLSTRWLPNVTLERRRGKPGWSKSARWAAA
jgi:Pyridoxamine 5'-phosphate oxidase